MKAVHFEGLKYYQFECYDCGEITHGIFTRKGGVSPSPWDSLNLGGTVGDSRENVVENRRRVFNALHLAVESIYDAWQVHGTTVIHVKQPRRLESPHIHGDILLTDRPGITLMMRFADCVPILLHDPIKKIIGIVHAGWKGSVERVAEKSIVAMQKGYGSNPADIIAGIGASICSEHYLVRKDVRDHAAGHIAHLLDEVFLEKNGQLHLDLWKLNEIILRESGVKKIQVSNQCTACDLEEWYSHRAQAGSTGRFAAVIALAG